MNPEFQRNVWLELTPLRMIVMTAVLALAFFAAGLTTDGGIFSPGSVARIGFYFIVVIWGARNAARSVVGEIRDRTWDGQRLSSLDAGTMMWGKLFGSTIYNWFGGVICLAVILAEAFNAHGPIDVAVQLAYYVAIGVITQAVSLLASLIAAGRRQGRTQFEIFLYQGAGLAAAWAVWSIADPATGSINRTDEILWWGQAVPTHGFLLGSLVVFTGWILAGCYRQMRLELKLNNGPLVWLAFLVFAAAYVAGFDAWMPKTMSYLDPAALRLALAGITCTGLAYIMVILEPKNRVSLRWIGSQLVHFRLGSAAMKLQGWMMAWLAAMAIGAALLVHLQLSGHDVQLFSVAAAMGFVSRDMAIVLLMNTAARRRGGDLLAIAVLVAAYFLLPSILSGMHYGMGQAAFLPRVTDPLWLSPALAWCEAVVLWVVAIVRISLPEERAA